MGLSRVEELEAKCSELEKLYKEAVQARDEAIEERRSATVILAFQLEKETHELNLKIEELNKANDRLLDENEDLDIKLEYARKDLKKLQKAHIKLQLETETYITERDDAIQKVKDLEKIVQTGNTSPENSEKDLDHENNSSNNNNSISGSSNDLTSTATVANTRNCTNNTSIKSSGDSNGKTNNTNNKGEAVNTNKVQQASDVNNHGDKTIAKKARKSFDIHKSMNSIDEDELEPRPPIKLKKSSIEDDYNVHEELGKGKFGVVKKVTHKSSGDVLAAKYIKTTSAGSSREDILREIDIMSRLHHKRLVGLLDAYDANKSIIMIMEFISGGELFERVVDEDCLTEKEAAYYMHQILQGLQHMHKKNILHLDLKPENIVCVSKESWDIKLIDFGLAMELKPGTKLKGMNGTPEFMAPETVNFDTIGKFSDMWSIGVIAYILLSGLSPFMGDDNNETLSNVTTAEWDFDDESFDVISDEAKEFISELLIKNPKNRNTVEDCLKHKWMKKSASSDADVKINTKKLKQFLAKRRWQKSVNALVAVRRLSSMTSLLGLNKARPSIAPLLSVVPASNEGSEEEEEEEEKQTKNKIDKNKKDEKIQEKKSKNVKPENETTKDDKNKQQQQQQEQKQVKEPKKKDVAPKKPVFTKELEDFTVHEGETVTMEAIIDGGPGCDVEWFFDGGEVDDREGVTITDHGGGRHTIVINECEEEDAGEYICMAMNDHGKARSRGFLIVEVDSESGPDIDPPTFTKELADMTVKEGGTATMEVTVSGEDYDLEWFKNAVDVVEGGRFSFTTKGAGQHALVITNVEDDDTGEYCCVAMNDGGRSTCAGYFTVEVDEEDEEEEGDSEDETDEEMYEEKNVQLKNEFIEDSYAIEEEIGRGRFGIVRKCVHIQTGIHFVAKSIKARPSQKQEFKREIDVLNVLRHPNVCRIRDAFERPREIVIVMEFNRGGDLLKRINEQPMSEPDSVNIIQQILEAVNYIHQESYMHLDIKPENVMFKREGGSTVKLIDFSLTRKYDPKVETKISQGTAEYIAPEIVNYDCVTPATDMWAVGVVTYMMLSGKSPFLGDSEADTFANITHCRWTFTDVFNDVSNEAKDYVSKLLVKQKTGRIKASECLRHPWITTVGVRGEKERSSRPTLSHTTSLSDLSTKLLSSGDIPESISSVESYLRMNSSSDDVFTEEDQRPSVDAKELEATLQVFMLKLRDVECERAELEEKLKTEENKAEELKNNKNSLSQKISTLEKENETLSSQIKSKNDLLVKVGNLETDAKHLKEQLEEKNKSQKTLEERCSNLRSKVEQYDFLEEKLYRYEREKKENVRKIQTLEEKLAEQKNLGEKFENKNAEKEKEKSSKIEELMVEKESIENKFNQLRQEKESLVSELTKKFTLMENQRKDAENHVESLDYKIKDLEKELQKRETDLSESNKKLEKSSKEIEKLKQRTSKELEEKVATLNEEKLEMQKESDKLKKQKEEAQKTCEELASKLSKAYNEMEKMKSSSILARDYDKLRRERDELKRNVSSLEEKCAKLSRDLKSRDTQISDLKKDLEQAEKEKRTIQERRKLSKINSETNSESLKSTILDLESTILAHKSTIAVSKGEIELLQEKLALEEDKNTRFREELLDKKREIDVLNAKLKVKVLESKSDKTVEEVNSKELEKVKKENKRLTEHNEELERIIKESVHKGTKERKLSFHQKEKQELEKQIENMKQSHQETRQELDEVTESLNKLSKQKEELTLGIAQKDKKIELYEKELKDFQNRKNQTSEKSDGNIENCFDNDEVLKDGLREAQHKAATLETELEQLKSQQEETENKWAKRLRKECSELQADLAEKFAQEKRSLLKKEADLQNMIRQMKILLEKRAKEAQAMKKKLEKHERVKTPSKNDLGSTPTINELHDSITKPHNSPGISPNHVKQEQDPHEKIDNPKETQEVNENSEESPEVAQETDQKQANSAEKSEGSLDVAKESNQKITKNAEMSRSTSKSSDLTSTASLDSGSMSDDTVDGRSFNAVQDGNTNKTNIKKDGLNDRDLRRVAYKLTNEEWTHLGSFLGVSDAELQNIIALNMAPQEKAFRLLCLWNTRSTLGKNQLVSQLAIALEEINRKDVALFVVEQMMTGKPRKKFFGWRK